MLELEIAVRQLANQLPSAPSELVLLDVREPWEVATAAISGSKNIPMGQITSRALQELDPATHIVTYCHSGIRSMDVALWLRNHGFDKAQSLRGGIDAWSREIDPTVPRY
jgi:rhodanese-related sulfurtransferase